MKSYPLNCIFILLIKNYFTDKNREVQTEDEFVHYNLGTCLQFETLLLYF